jgi:hypothetical protein
MAKYLQSIILSYCSISMQVSGVCFVDVLVCPLVLCVADTTHVHTFMKWHITWIVLPFSLLLIYVHILYLIIFELHFSPSPLQKIIPSSVKTAAPTVSMLTQFAQELSYVVKESFTVLTYTTLCISL